VWPVIKANAYGHGSEIVASTLVAEGVDTLCFATVSETLHLKRRGINVRSIILNPLLGSSLSEAVDNAIEVVLCNQRQLDELAARSDTDARPVYAHILVDTGMARAGVQPDEFDAFVSACDKVSKLNIVGVMSQLACADNPDNPVSQQQLEVFLALRADDQRLTEAQWHLFNSAGLLSLDGSALDAVRPGIAMYGLNPFSPNIAHPSISELRPVLELHSTITHVELLPAGRGVSYGHRFVTTRETLIATVPVGYGDGLSRALSGRMDMLVQGVRCPQVGTITMDQCMIDVTALKGRVSVGDSVVVVGEQGNECISIDELAASAATINYEIVTALADRVPRFLVD